MLDQNGLNTDIYIDEVIKAPQEIYTTTVQEDDIEDDSNNAWPTLAIICIIAIIAAIVIAIVKDKDKDKK